MRKYAVYNRHPHRGAFIVVNLLPARTAYNRRYIPRKERG